MSNRKLRIWGRSVNYHFEVFVIVVLRVRNEGEMSLLR
jgi:hypothetical protein